MICISLLVHEKPLVVKDLIDNILKYNNDCFIVININGNHLKQFMLESDNLNIFNEYDEKVIFNNNYINIEYSKYGYNEAFLSNFNFAKKHKKFTHYVLQSSNIMYLKNGCSDYIRLHNNGMFNSENIYNSNSSYWVNSIKCPIFSNLFSGTNWDKCYISQWEGSFFEFDKFQSISEYLDQYYPNTHTHTHTHTPDLRKL